MECVNYSLGVEESFFCNGDSINHTILANYILTGTTNSSFSFGIKNITSPPTVSSTLISDSFSITSTIDGYSVDTCNTVFVSGLSPNPFYNLAITPTTNPLTIGSTTNIIIDFTVSDSIDQSDVITVIFPDEIAPNISTVDFSNFGFYSYQLIGQNLIISLTKPYSLNANKSL
jgi:hypothetical protein